MSTNSVALTIAVPAYKRPERLRTLLEQILAQAGPDDEILVSDDDSSDETAAAIETMPGVRLLRHQTNIGMVANWNACLTEATRDWICIVHDDDQLAPGGLAALRRACALAGGPALVAHVPFNPDSDETFRCRFEDAGPWTVLHSPGMPSGVVVHRAVVEAVGRFDPRFRYSSDLEYFPRICTRFPMVTVESPAVLNIQFHGANYQFKTWRQPDFLSQFEELHRTIIRYAGLTGKAADALLDEHMTGNLSYMFSQARFWRDTGMMRLLGRKLLFRKAIHLRYRLVILLAALTGWTVRPRRDPWRGGSRPA